MHWIVMKVVDTLMPFTDNDVYFLPSAQSPSMNTNPKMLNVSAERNPRREKLQGRLVACGFCVIE